MRLSKEACIGSVKLIAIPNWYSRTVSLT